MSFKFNFVLLNSQLLYAVYDTYWFGILLKSMVS